jgi:DNA invertase Pin-like site-specific DNA recombinase
MNKAVGYIRVSTTEQATEGVSLLAQETKIKLYCELNDLDLIDIKEDAGISGKYIKKRPGIQKALSMINQGEAQHLIIFKLDRMCRNLKEACEIADLLLEKSASLHSVSEKIDTGSATGKLFYHILSAMAEWERGIISERTLEGISQKRKLGQKLGGRMPFGKNKGSCIVTEKGKTVYNLIQNMQEIKAIEIAAQLRAEGMPLSKISEALEGRGFISPRTGTRYGKSSISLMLKRAS